MESGLKKRLWQYREILKKEPMWLEISDRLYEEEEFTAQNITALYVMAPIMCRFVLWVLRQAMEAGKSRLYFLARDGYSMYQTARILCEKWKLPIECRYLYCSRYALRGAEYYLLREESVSYICLGGIDVTFEKMMRRAGLDDAEMQEVARTIGFTKECRQPLSYSSVKALETDLKACSVFVDRLVSHAEEKYVTICGYLKQEGLLDEKDYAVVDSGWVGSMYLPKAVIKKMVEKCGFRESDRAAGICEYFISCEEGAAKGNGSLFERVKDTYGPYKKYIHMGDNPAADVKWARKSGFDAEFYQNVNIAGMPYRAEDMSIINGSVYRGIVNMLTDMCRNINLSRYEKFVDKNVEVIKAYLLEHWEEVLAHYDKQLAAGKLYYEKVLAGFKRVAAVDVGWAGSGAVSLNYVINHIWQLNCEVTGLVAGTNTIHNAEPNMSEPQLHSGELESYLFSQGHNRDSWKWHDAAKGHNVGIELLCSSAGGSVKGFYPKRNADGKADYTVHFKEADMSPAVVSEIQKGITDFVKLVLAVPERACLLQAVTGSDVYGVMKVFLEKENYASLMEAINDSGGEAIEMGI